MQLVQVLIVLIIFGNVNCYNILGVFLYDGESHFKVAQPLLKELSRRGHNVTVLSYFSLQDKVTGYTDITWENPKILVDISYYSKLNSRISKYASPHIIISGTKKRCETIVNTEKFRNVLKDADNYDIIITEFFDSNCFLYPFLARNKIPFIGIESHALLPWTNDWVGNPHNPAYVPVVFLDFSYIMNFWERLENTFMWIYSYIFYNLVIKPQDYNFFRSHFENNQHLDNNVMLNTSLILTNSYFALHGSRPFVPNVVEVGGIHVETPRKLPMHIEKWINESTDGVIYFSLGSIIKGHTFPEDKRKMFINVFSRFSHRIIWKWEIDTMPDKPKNIMIQKWMPQLDILCHPNVKAFIGHGGLLGTIEAVHCGVPVIAMPQFGDQFTNSKALELNGGGVILDFHSLDEKFIFRALTTVLDPSFNKKVKELSARFRDRQVSPLETAAYWVEYVARHGGAPHLRTAAVGMPLYQYLLLDVVAFLTVIFIMFIYVFFVIFRSTYRIIFKVKRKVKNH